MTSSYFRGTELWTSVFLSLFLVGAVATKVSSSPKKDDRKGGKGAEVEKAQSQKVYIDEKQESNGTWTFVEGKRDPHLLGNIVGRSTWSCVDDGTPQTSFDFDREVNPNSADLPYRATRAKQTYKLPSIEGNEESKAAASAAVLGESLTFYALLCVLNHLQDPHFTPNCRLPRVSFPEIMVGRCFSFPAWSLQVMSRILSLEKPEKKQC